MALLLPDLVDGADIGMVESGGRLRLPLETGQGLRVLRHIIGQKLEGNKPVQVYVLGLVDHTHTAAAQFLDDAVVRDGLTDHSGGVRSFRLLHVKDAASASQRRTLWVRVRRHPKACLTTG